jgi:hypothetical protein
LRSPLNSISLGRYTQIIVTPSALQGILIRLLAQRSTDHRLGRGQHYLVEDVKRGCPAADQPSRDQFLQAVWALIAQGLAYIDPYDHATENWSVLLTESGQAVARDSESNPDDPDGYLRSLYGAVPNLAPTTRVYVEEALRAYNHQCYLSATVMLGVAAEAMVLQLASVFVNSKRGSTSPTFVAVLQSPKIAYVQKFTELRKRLDTAREILPAELSDNLDIQLNAVLELLRTSRNDSGHPTGRTVRSVDCFNNLRIFPGLARRIQELDAFFAEDSVTVA